MLSQTVSIPDYYEGKLLFEEKSQELKDELISHIIKLESINDFFIPAILYISAWENKNNDIWYEYAGENFKKIFNAEITELPHIFRNSVLDRKVYTKNENQVKIHTLHKELFFKKRFHIRSEIENSGFNEAVYKIKLNNDILWLKDQAYIIPFEKDNITISIGNLTNVTKEMEAEEARQRAEKALLKKEQLLRSMFKQAYDPIVITDMKGKILDCNEAAEKTFFYEKKDIISANYLNFISIEKANEFQENVSLIHSKKNIRIETTILDKKGKSIPVEISVVKIDNTPAVTQASIRDLSDKVKLESEKIKRSKFELVSTMATGIAHDTNNILSVILGNLSLASLEVSKTKEQDKIKNSLKRIEKASNHLASLTKRFFEFSETAPIIKTQKEVHSFFENILNEFSNFMKINIEKEESIDYIKINPDIMTIALKALITNALESMENVSTKQLDIKITRINISDTMNESEPTLKPGQYVKISIKDYGKGISEENMERIFDPYFSTKPLSSKKGTGLGLTNAYSAIKQHGGHLTVTSKQTTGTSVIMYLPE